MNVILKGIYTALSTKFIYNHDLDIPAYLLNIKQQIEVGFHHQVIGIALVRLVFLRRMKNKSSTNYYKYS